MLYCGVENPVVENNNILSYDIGTDRMNRGVVLPGNLWRYSFVGVTKEELKDSYCKVFGWVQSSLGCAGLYLTAWNERGAAMTPAKCRAIEHGYKKRLWRVAHADGVGIATAKCAVPFVDDAHACWSRDTMVLFGWNDGARLDELSILARATARAGYSAPSPQDTAVLSGNGLALAYLQYDDASPPAVIVVAGTRLADDQIEGIGVQSIFYGDDSAKAWTRSLENSDPPRPCP